MADHTNLYTTTPKTIVLYSTTWCPDCKRTRAFLNEHNVSYLDVDIGKDNAAMTFLEGISKQRIHIPTVIFPDGTIIIEPSNEDLRVKLGL
ncbi:MAG: glutaredoxin family protein [Anaerolineales bacterium]